MTQQSSRTKKTLTAREQKVLSLIARGLTSPQIAKKLRISPETVKTHRKNMIRKCRVHNTFELVRLGVSRKWV